MRVISPVLGAALWLSPALRVVPPRASLEPPDAAGLSERIAQVKRQEELRAAELQVRLADLRAADEREKNLASLEDLPVVCFDAMLPGQRMDLDTDDPAFSMLLQTLGLGGLVSARAT